MPHFVYIIQSQVDNSYYVGETHDIALRIQRHNDGWSRSTKSKRPWTLVYQEEYPTRSDALRREKEIKRMKSKSYIQRLISNAGGRPDGR